jgi:diguanylate cyclase (GGDEF)-like protein/putative nucleotidyltransferase with HDIG domain
VSPALSSGSATAGPARRVMSRGAGMVLVALLFLGVTGFAGWAALATRSSARGAASASRVADAYQQAHYALINIDVSEQSYRMLPVPDVATRLTAGQIHLASALSQVAADGDRSDRALARRLQSQSRSLGRSLAGLVAAAARGDAQGMQRIDQRDVRPLLAGMERSVNTANASHHRQLQTSLASAGRSQSVVLVATAIMVVLGILVVGAFAVVVRYRRRLDAVSQAELERLRGAAFTDSLTGMPNHRAFQEALAALLEAEADLCVALVDLDGTKAINDSRGHQAGDELIQALGECLTGLALPGQHTYRTGGDEFAVVLEGGRAMAGFYLAQHLHDRMAEREDALSATVGVAESWPGGSRDALLGRADLALREAKRSHRGVLTYSPDMEAADRQAQADTDGDRRHATTLATSLARAVDAKDSYTHSHCETVAEMCALMAQHLGLDPERVARVRLAGLLHDVGKIGVSDTILHKPGPLTDEEFEVMKTHPTLGAHIVSAAELIEEAEWIRHHHERMDGRGYPDRLADQEIPLESRIIMVADAFEAITATRPYRAARSVGEALLELERHAGSQFDPQCVAALRAILSQQLTIDLGAARQARQLRRAA